MYITTLICFALTVLIEAIFCESLLQVKHRGVLCACFVLLAFLFPVFEYFGLMQMFRPSVSRSILTVIPMFFCTVLLCRDSLVTKVFIFFLSLLLLVFPEIIISIPCTLLLAGLTGASTDGFASTPLMIPIQILYLLFEMVSMFIVSGLIRKKQKKVNTPALSRFILFLVVQFALFMGFVWFTVTQFDDITAINPSSIQFCMQIGILSVLADLAIYIILLRIQEKERLRYQSEFYEKQLELQLTHLQDFSLYDETLAHIRHDLRSQLSTLQALVAQKEYDAAASLTDTLQQTLDDLKIISCCENSLVNALIFSRYKHMHRAGIPFTCQADIRKDLPIPDRLLCETLSELLDEASAEYENLSERKSDLPVQLSIRQQSDFLEITLSGAIERSVRLSYGKESSSC